MKTLEILQFLAEHHESWFNSTDIRLAVNVSRFTLYSRLGDLVATGLVQLDYMKKESDLIARPHWRSKVKPT